MATEEHVFKSHVADVEIPVVPLTNFVLETASSRGDAPALIDGKSGRTIKYSELEAGIYRAANGLAELGFKKGDVLAIHMPNVPEYALAFHGAALLGGTITTSNPLYGVREIAHQLKDANAKFLLTVGPFLEACTEAAAEAGVEKVFTLEGEDCFLRCANAEKPAEVDIDPLKDIVAIPYSSGTSGLPKGVMLSHHNIVSNLCQIGSGATGGFSLDITPDDVVLAVLPFFHIYGMVVILNSGLRVGCTCVTMPKFDPADFLGFIQTYKVTFAPIVPPLVLFLAKHPVVDKFDTSSLRVMFSGAAPLDASLAGAAAARLGAVVRQGYGMTEMSPAAYITDPSANKPGSCGRLVPNCTAKIVDPNTGKALGPGPENQGELWVRGPNIMQGYLNNAEATAATIDADGYLHTGDIAYIDEEGFCFICDRLKELIKVKGFQVAPAELEGLLLEHEGIADAAVIGVPDERAGELPKAFVVKAPGAELDEEAVMSYIASKVADFKQVKVVEFRESIPKSASGKILKRVLKEEEKKAREAAAGGAGGDDA